MGSKQKYDPVIALANVTGPLLELFSVLDDVFTEDDAFNPTKRMAGLGRCYRAWKKCREELDPLYRGDNRDNRGNQLHRSTKGKSTAATVSEDDRVVLRTRRRRKN